MNDGDRDGVEKRVSQPLDLHTYRRGDNPRRNDGRIQVIWGEGVKVAPFQ